MQFDDIDQAITAICDSVDGVLNLFADSRALASMFKLRIEIIEYQELVIEYPVIDAINEIQDTLIQ